MLGLIAFVRIHISTTGLCRGSDLTSIFMKTKEKLFTGNAISGAIMLIVSRHVVNGLSIGYY